jgi:uncharacterized damage-inducible protein DinB
MNKQDIEHLYAYDRWANAKTLDVAARLTPEQYTQHLGNSHASVRDTLAHILAADWIWLMRWRGTSPKALFNPEDFPDMESLRAKWAEIESEQAEFINVLTDEALATVIVYTNTKGEEWAYPLGDLMQHLVNHSSYHRGQVTTMLRQLGAEAVSTDLLYFLDAKAATV